MDKIAFRKETSEVYLKAVPELSSVVHGQRGITKSIIEWKYINNPSGKAHVWIASDINNNKIVGTYALCPWKMNCNGKNYDAVQAVDAMVHPDYRKMGIFTQLQKTAIKDLENSEYKIAISFPPANSYLGHIKAGWIKVGNLFDYTFIMRPVDKIFDKNAYKFIKKTFLDEIYYRGICMMYSKYVAFNKENGKKEF